MLPFLLPYGAMLFWSGEGKREVLAAHSIRCLQGLLLGRPGSALRATAVILPAPQTLSGSSVRTANCAGRGALMWGRWESRCVVTIATSLPVLPFCFYPAQHWEAKCSGLQSTEDHWTTKRVALFCQLPMGPSQDRDHDFILSTIVWPMFTSLGSWKVCIM